MKISSERPSSRRGKRLLLLLLLLFVTGILLSTTTYAWFTANRTITINTITVNVSAQNGIQVSVDGTNWRTIIQTTDITNASATYAAAKNQLPAAMEPVSTTGIATGAGALPMYYGTVETSEFEGHCSVDPDANTTEAACRAALGVWTPSTLGQQILTSTLQNDVNGTSGRYITFDLFFRVESQSQTWLTGSSGVRYAGTDMGIQNASRMAFLTLGNTASGSPIGTIQALTSATAPVFLWEPNRDTHSATGVANANDVYGITSTQLAAYATANNPVPYEGVATGITTENNVVLGKANSTSAVIPAYCTSNGTTPDYAFADETTCLANGGTYAWIPATTNAAYFEPIVPTLHTPATNADSQEFLLLSAGITKVRVYMWIEGQDVDCENSASGGNINYDLQVTIIDPEA